METKQLIHNIDRILEEIDSRTHKNFKDGLCVITNALHFKIANEVRCKLYQRGVAKGLNPHINHSCRYWWDYNNSPTTATEWYAPRIKFLKDWKNELQTQITQTV
jgi:hypothetical protein